MTRWTWSWLGSLWTWLLLLAGWQERQLGKRPGLLGFRQSKLRDLVETQIFVRGALIGRHAGCP